MKNKIWFILVILVLPLVSGLACGGTESVASASSSNAAAEVEQKETPTAVPDKLADVAVMQGSVVVHKDQGYVMSEQGLSLEILAKRSACFSALASGEESDFCSANLAAEFERMPGACTVSASAEAGKTGICSHVTKQ